MFDLTLLRSACLDALAVVVPVSCAGCGADGRGLCAGCRGSLQLDVPIRARIGDLEVVSGLEYSGVARRVIVAMKEQGRTDVASVLARPLAAAVAAAVRGEVELAAVPPGPGARRRGYDPLALLIDRAGLPRPARVVTRVRRTAVQKELDRGARVENLRGAFTAVADLRGRRFVLVDDICTTGSTLRELSRAISAAGGVVVAGATAAATPRRVGHGDASDP